MKQIKPSLFLSLLSLALLLGCSKELPFPETEEAIAESVDMTVRIEASAREIVENAFGEGNDVNLKELTKQLKKIDNVIDADLYDCIV